MGKPLNCCCIKINRISILFFRQSQSWRVQLKFCQNRRRFWKVLRFFKIIGVMLQIWDSRYRPKLLTPLLCLFRVNTPQLSLGNATSGCIFAAVKLRSDCKVAAVKLALVKPWLLKCGSQLLKSFQSKVLLVTSNILQ